MNESKNNKIDRLSNNTPHEAIGTLLNSISLYLNSEIKIASEQKQTTLLFLGIHASMLTISEALFGQKKDSLDNYKIYLEKFTNQANENNNFFSIADKIHNWRNIVAHQLISSAGHNISFDYNMTEGWKMDNKILFINPKVYCDSYLESFSEDGKIWLYESIFSKTALDEAKNRILNKYKKR